MKKSLIHLLLRILALFSKKTGLSDHFLIVSTTGLGDSLWGTPALRALRHAFPKGHIDLLTSSLGREVFINNPHLDEIFVLEKPLFSSLIRLYFLLRRKNIGTAFIFHTSQRMVIPLCSAIGIKKIIGTVGINKGFDDLLTTALPSKREHEIQRRIAMIALCGKIENPPIMEIFPDESAHKETENFLKKEAIEPYLPLVAIHPGAKDRFKQWPPEYFVILGKRLIEHLGCALIVSGTEAEAPLIHSIASRIPGAIELKGELGIHAFAKLIKKCSLFITNDTGPMHIAFTMQTPTVALFTPTDPQLCGPYFIDRVACLSKQPTCKPCLKKKCQNPFCLLQISPDAVFDAAIRLFYQGQGK